MALCDDLCAHVDKYHLFSESGFMSQDQGHKDIDIIRYTRGVETIDVSRDYQYTRS